MQKCISQTPVLCTRCAILVNTGEHEYVYEHVNVTMSTLEFAPLRIPTCTQTFDLLTIAQFI
jgi:hypothetical protein